MSNQNFMPGSDWLSRKRVRDVEQQPLRADNEIQQKRRRRDDGDEDDGNMSISSAEDDDTRLKMPQMAASRRKKRFIAQNHDGKAEQQAGLVALPAQAEVAAQQVRAEALRGMNAELDAELLGDMGDVPIAYAPLDECDALLRDDTHAMSKSCFLCEYNSKSEQPSSILTQLLVLMDETYGRVSNYQFAQYVQSYYEKHIRWRERNPGNELPAWSLQTIIDHVEYHAPKPKYIALRVARDMNRMLQVLSRNCIVTIDGDGVKGLDKGNVAMYLKIQKELRCTIRETNT